MKYYTLDKLINCLEKYFLYNRLDLLQIAVDNLGVVL